MTNLLCIHIHVITVLNFVFMFPWTICLTIYHFLDTNIARILCNVVHATPPQDDNVLVCEKKKAPIGVRNTVVIHLENNRTLQNMYVLM